jgi:hypothetical protein
LLTLKTSAQVAQLPAYFTSDELAALFTWMVDKDNDRKLPDTLCDIKVPRNYLPSQPKIVDDPTLYEVEISLMPFDVFPKSMPDIHYKGFQKAEKTFTNVITIVPNKDILFTSYMCRSGIPKMPSKIYYDASRKKFVRMECEVPKLQVKVDVAIDGRFIASDSIEFTDYKDEGGQYLASPQPMLKRKQKYQIAFSLKVVSGTGVFDDVSVDKVNNHIHDQLDKTAFKSVKFEAPEIDTPLFVSLFACIVLQ